MDEELPRARPAIVLGEDLDRLSVAEFDERIRLLQAEIVRLEAARERKRFARDAAASVFRT